MKRFLDVVLRIILVMLVSCLLIIVHARSEPIPTLVEHLDDCKGHLCFIGIVPGYTNWATAQATFSNWTSANIFEDSIQINLNHMDVLFETTDDLKSVGNISFSFEQLFRPTFSTLLFRYGPPCVISVNADIGFVALRYDYMTAYIHLKDLENDSAALHLEPSSPINGLTLHSELDKCLVQDRYWETYWRGFTPFTYYQ